jgi:hypothetical protein
MKNLSTIAITLALCGLAQAAEPNRFICSNKKITADKTIEFTYVIRNANVTRNTVATPGLTGHIGPVELRVQRDIPLSEKTKWGSLITFATKLVETGFDEFFGFNLPVMC